MIIIFTPQERPTPPAVSRQRANRGTHQTRFTPNRPLLDAQVEEEAVFTDPFGPAGASDR